MKELPENTKAFLTYIGCTTTRVGPDMWIINDPETDPYKAGRAIFNGATIDSATRFPQVKP